MKKLQRPIQRCECLEDRLAPSAAAEVYYDFRQTADNNFVGTGTEFNGFYYFTHEIATIGRELWRTDGTSSGTTLICDINPGSNSSQPTDLINLNGILIFSAYEGVNGSELWRSDGTSTGTTLIRDIRPGITGSYPTYLTEVNGVIFFRANDGVTGGELWRTDGTSTGTFLVRDVDPGTSDVYLRYLTPVGGLLYFRHYTPATGIELWKSDGTSTGTQLVRDIVGGSAGSFPLRLTEMNSALYFTVNDGSGNALWRSDGTSAGTLIVGQFEDPILNSTIQNLTNIGGQLYFTTEQRVLWRSDGTSTGTTRIRGIERYTPNMRSAGFTDVGGKLFFMTNDSASLGGDFWVSDGSSSGTKVLRSFRSTFGMTNYTSAIVSVAKFAGSAVFKANETGTGYELWKSDSTSSGTQLVRDLMPGRGSGLDSPTTAGLPQFGVAGDYLYFRGNDARTGDELWRTDGTANGTQLIYDGNLTPVSTTPENLTAFGSGTLFTATAATTTNDGSVLLFRSDGTESGTKAVGAFFASVFSQAVRGLTVVGPVAYFYGGTPEAGLELWKTDGTSSGTVLVRDIIPGSTGSRTVTLPSPRHLMAAIGGTVYFHANDGVNGYELWKSDGTSSGTVMVRDIRPGVSGSSPANFLVHSGTLYFSANDGANGFELWASDGTSSGTRMVRDINGGNQNGFLENHPIASLGGMVVFGGFNGSLGLELWRSDGTSSGTQLVSDIQPSTASGVSGGFLTHNNRLYFTGNDGVSGIELWASNGTSSGTMLVRDVRPGSGAANVANLTGLGNAILFQAFDGVLGNELWRTDGTSSGTTLVKDIRTGTDSSNPSYLTAVNGHVYFQANNGTVGTELWRSDGTEGGTVLVTDVQPGSQSSAPAPLLNAAGTLVFIANRAAVGVELFKLQLTPPVVTAITSTSPNGTYSTGQTIDITLTFSEPVSLADGPLNLTLDTGAVVSVNPFSGSAASAIYTVAAGETSSDLNVTAMTLAPGARLIDSIGNDASLTLPASNLANNANLIVNPPPPTTVTQLTVNFGASQRSRLTAIELTFSAPVNAAGLAAPGAITLTRTLGPNPGTIVATGASGANGRILTSPASGMTTVLTLSFDNANGSGLGDGVEFGSLADGRWQLAVPSLNYQSTLNGTALRRIFGDANSDGTVDGVDFANFGAAFGQSLANSPFDFDANATIDANDLAAFGGRFGLSL